MAIETIVPSVAQSWPLRIRAPRPAVARSLTTIRIGLLGLGQVGQAVARLAADRAVTADTAVHFRVDQALVRDAARPRACPAVELTSSVDEFLRGQYDVVVEALDGIEPARAIVTTLLGRGTPVVTANKALVAQHGAQLDAIARAHRAAFRYEATALAAVPFLGTLAERPLVASVHRFTAIVNGTTNYVLSSIAGEGLTFEQALARAQELGYAEPDPSRDLDGLDAADKLLLLASLFGWGRLSREALDVAGVRTVTPGDLAAARAAGGAIKPIVFGERDAAGVCAFVAPAFLSSSEPLASLGGALNGIRLDGRHVSNLFFSGPGAGPDVTAATLLDDAVQAATSKREALAPAVTPRHTIFPTSPATPWLLRVTFPGVLPSAPAVSSLVYHAGLRVEQVLDHADDHSRWLSIGLEGRRAVDAAMARLAATHRIEAAAFRRV